MTLIEAWRTATADPVTVAKASQAFALFKSWTRDLPRVPGMATLDRLCVRVYEGRTIEEAAAREYLYRWQLAIKEPDQVLNTRVRNPVCSCFGAPHPIGL